MRSRVTALIRRRTTVPDNSFYYHLGYAVATGIYVVYSAALVMRWNRVKARLPGNDD
jgi:hypothetical protein